MSEELAYVIINPYTIAKSRTGGVIARLLSRSKAELVAARMFAPSKELIEEYIDALKRSKSEEHEDVRELFHQYLMENYAPCEKTGLRRRVMFLVFKGKDAVEQLRSEVVGHITRETVAGETVRDTYGDYVKDAEGNVKYFEPAVIMGTDPGNVGDEIKLWARYSDKDSGILDDVVKYKDGVVPQKTLVLIKPDCFQWPSSRPGSIIDTFSRTGLYIISVKVLKMTVKQALEFYGPVKSILLKKFDNDVKRTEEQFNQIIQFMTGCDPKEIDQEKDGANSGKVRCLALVYQGQDAISKIRAVLGSTDPNKAAPSTVRKEFGKDVMVNTAHASDSEENAKREMKIVSLGENCFKKLIEDFYKAAL